VKKAVVDFSLLACVLIEGHLDGIWPPLSSFIISTLGIGFILGLGLYNWICVLSTPKQVAALLSFAFLLV
jgi:lipid-binding SYLF domain-containing protein